jgi:hypothetical protein
MAITGLESKASTALTGLSRSDDAVQQMGIVVKDLATAVEQLSRELDDIKGRVQGLDAVASKEFEEEIDEP